MITFRKSIQSEREKRFWSHVDKNENGCWIWRGAKFSNGYGRVRLSTTKTVSAHRLAYEFRHGSIPRDLCACHKCDVRDCVNPSHIFIGTFDDNNKDRSNKGRNARLFGEDSPRSKLTNESVIEIRKRRSNGDGLKVLANEFNTTPQNICMIANKKSWSHI